jgi:uncharacterized protein (TIGR00255 family)
LYRGSVSYTLHMRDSSDGGALKVNQAAAESYMTHLKQLATLHGNSNNIKINLADLLVLPGVCLPQVYSRQQHQDLLEIIRAVTIQALARLQEMRAEEGQGILQDLRQQCKSIADNLSALSGLTTTVVGNYHRRLQQRANELLASVGSQLDEASLSREVAIFAERSDINEEISRLSSHLQLFESTCCSEQQAGRRLDFLTQEMLREANTIASKANDAKISQHVVEIKVAIDRLREQVQNVE